MSNRNEPVIVEESFSVDRATLWDAITDHAKMIKWFFHEIPEFRPEAGFETGFNVSVEDRDFYHQWRIVEAVTNERILYDWSYRDLPGVGKVTFELTDCDQSSAGGSNLRLVNEGLETFPDDVPEFTRESAVGGWTFFIKEELPKFLASQTIIRSLQ